MTMERRRPNVRVRARRAASLRDKVLLGAAIIGAAACGVAGEPTAVIVDVKDAMLQPRGAFWTGVYLGDALTTPENVASGLRAFAAMTASEPALVKTYHHLDADLSATGWSGRLVRAIAGAGATNFVALDLDWGGRPAGSLLDAINRGDADARIDRVARSLAALGGTVLVEPAWEMNGDWHYKWQGVANGRDAQAPAKFVQAWHRVHDRFRAAGVTNVRWVFNPNVGNVVAGRAAGPDHWNWYGHYYPGDTYVDFIGAHGFNGPAAFNAPHREFSDLFDGADADWMLRDMKQRHPRKPIIIGELASEETAGHDKGAWVRSAYARMLADPQIVGAVWFNMDKEADWRLESSAGSLAAYRDAMQHGAISTRYSDAALAPGMTVAVR